MVKAKHIPSFSLEFSPEKERNPPSHPHLTPTPRKELLKLCVSSEFSNTDSDSSSTMPNYYFSSPDCDSDNDLD